MKTMKFLSQHIANSLSAALLLGALLLLGTPMKAQTKNIPDAFETMDPAKIIGDGYYYYIQFYNGSDRSFLSDQGELNNASSKDYIPFAKNIQWTLESTGTAGQFYLKSGNGRYIYLDGSNYKCSSTHKSALTIAERTNSTSGGGYDISTVSAPNNAMGRPGSSGVAPVWTDITSINHNNHRVLYTRLRIAKLKDNIAHIIYWQEPILRENGSEIDRNTKTRGGSAGFMKRHYLTYSGTDNTKPSESEKPFWTSEVSSRSSILTTYDNWALATASAYHKDGLWTLEESDVDGLFYIKKYGNSQYLNEHNHDNTGNYDCALEAKDASKGTYTLEAPNANRYTRIKNVKYTTEQLSSGMFYNWNGYGANANQGSQASVAFNVGNNVQIAADGMVAGTSNVDHLIYADLSSYSRMIINGTQDMQLRVLMSRQESNNGPLVEKNVTIGSDGTAVVDLTDLYLKDDPTHPLTTKTGSATVKMTYVSGSDGTPKTGTGATGNIENNIDISYGEIVSGESSKSGYNKIENGKVELATKGWDVNFITYLQVDASAIPGIITKVTLRADVSGSMDNKRNTQWGVGYNNSEWKADMKWNSADRSITQLGTEVWTGMNSNYSTSFENKEFDITNAFTVNAGKKVATILVYELEPGGGYIKNPTVEIEYTPNVNTVNINYAHLNAIKTAAGSPAGTISNITLLRENTSNTRYLHHAIGDGWQVLQWSGNDPDYWYAGFYPVEVLDEDNFYKVELKMGEQMLATDATLKTYNSFAPDLWHLEQLDDYKHFRLQNQFGQYYTGLGNSLADNPPSGNDVGIFTNDDLNYYFSIKWVPNTETRIVHNVTHKESNVRLYYTYNSTTAEQQKVLGNQGLITDADSEWWDSQKRTQKVNEFIITHYVKQGDIVEFGLPTVLGTSNDHILYQRWYEYKNDTNLDNLKNHFKLKTSGGEVMSYLYNNGLVTGDRLDWPFVFPGASKFESYIFTYYNSDGQPFALAADVSRYSDFTYLNSNSHLDGDLQEPSLTMRYIYYMRDAKVMAADLMDNTEGSGDWLEEKDFHFPATRVAYDANKPEAYQGEFIGIYHQFKDYWVFDGNGTGNDNLVSAVINNSSGHIEVVVEANGTGITLGGKNNKGYYLYDEGKSNGSPSYGDSRFVAFKYPVGGTVTATGETNAAYLKVYFKNNGTRYQIAKFKLIFDENTTTLPWTSVNESEMVKNSDRDPKNLEKRAGKPIAKVSFDYPTGATFKNSSDYTLHNKGVMEGWWSEIPNSSPLPLTFDKTNYGFDGDNPSWGSYALVTTMPTRYGNNKTTLPANHATYGYGIDPDAGMQSAFLYIDASEQPGDICAVPFVGEFCSGDKLMCTGWISGSNRMFNDDRCPGSVILTVKGERMVDGELKEETIYRFCPGQCYELDNGTGIDGATGSYVVWQQFYFEFEINNKYLRQWVEVNNNCVSSTGGDFMLDNIEVYAMVPEVNAEMNTPICIDHDQSEMRLLKFTVGYEKLLNNARITEVTGNGTATPHYLGLAFLEKNVFLNTLKTQLNYAGTISQLETAIANGDYANILNTNRDAYEAAFDAALLGDKRLWNSWELTSNEGAGLLNFRWYDKFSEMETFSFNKAVNKENSIFGYTDPETGERILVMNGNYPQLPWKPNTDYYIISSNVGINTSDLYLDFNICSECSKATVFQLDPPYQIVTMDATSSTEEALVCEGKIPTILTDLMGYDVNGNLVALQDLNFDWWLGDPANGLVATLSNYHEQHLGHVYLDRSLSYLRKYYPDATTLEGLTPNATLTQDMLSYLQELVDRGQLVLHQKSVSVPAEKTSDDDPYLRLVACPIHDASFDQSLKTTIVDGENTIVRVAAYFCDEPQEIRMRIGEKAPSLKCGFVPQENGFPSYDYAGDPILSIRLAKRAQFMTVQHGEANAETIDTPTEANAENIHFLWLPIRNALVQSEGSERVIQKSGDENIYLSSTNDPVWDKSIYTAMKAPVSSLPVVGKIVQLNAIDASTESGVNAQNAENRLCVYFTQNFEVREGYTYTLSLPFKESPGSNTCDGTLLLNLKIVPDYEVWTGGADNTDWNNDNNWRRADGNLGTSTEESKNGAGRNNNELYVTDDLPETSGLYQYTTNYTNYRTAKDRLLRKGFAPLYCTHILLKSNEWGDAPQLYDALNGESALTNAPFPNLSEAVTENTTVPSYGIDQRFTSIAELSGQSFAIVNESEGKVIYGTNAQNLGYAEYSAAYQSTNSCYYFKLENGPERDSKPTYLLRAYAPSGNPYDFYAWNSWHYNNYLNSQPDGRAEKCSFILGLNNQWGQDAENFALWNIIPDPAGTGKFALQNVGSTKYLKDNSYAYYDDPTYFTFCTLRNTEVKTLTVSQNNILKFDLQARLYDIWSDTYGSEPNKGRAGDLIAEMYQINSCDEIAFQPGTELLNAHLLNYNNAWMEYQLDMNRWYLLGSPLQGTIAGEWYAPTGTAQQKTTYYEPVTFGTGYDRYSPAFFQRSWDKAKAVLYEVGANYSTADNPNDMELVDGQLPGSPLQGKWSNTDWNTTGADSYLDRLGYKPMGDKKANVAIKGIWSNTYNDATVDYATGGFSVMVLNNLKGKSNGNPAIVRLPKEDTMYDYYKYEETGTDDGGTDTDLTTVQTALNRAKNRGRLKTDKLLPVSDASLQEYQKIQRLEKEVVAPQSYRYGDRRTYTRVPTAVGSDDDKLPLNLQAITETVPAGISNLGYYLVENPFPCGLNMDEFFAQNTGLAKKYWLLTATGQHLVQMASDGSWIQQTSDAFAAAEAIVAPGQGFFVQATTAGDATTITFTAAMQAQTRYGVKTGSQTFNVVVGTQQKMEEVTATNDDGETVTYEAPMVDDEGNYVVEDITEDITISTYVQDTGTPGHSFPLRARTRADGASFPGLVITARRDSLQSSALVMQRQGASNDFLPAEDTETFISIDELKQVPTVYTLCGRLATTVNSIRDFRSLPLGVESASDAPCTLTFHGVEALGDSVAVYDARERTLTPITSGHQLTVSGQTQNRYYLVRGLTLEEAQRENNLQIFGRQRQVTVVASTDEPITSIRCIDAAGRLVYTAAPQESTHSFTLPASGVYIIEAQTARDRATKKLIPGS